MPRAVTSSRNCAARRAWLARWSNRKTFSPSPSLRQPPTTALRHERTRPAHPAWNLATIRRRRDMRLRPSAKGYSRKASTRLASHIPAGRGIDSLEVEIATEQTKKGVEDIHMYDTTARELWSAPKVRDGNAAGWF
ncbi:hypothetical protein QR685DRAFT_538172 [Neurospora intermedia]|uniref:Uncharacterized protein n=1 Tax=Neurospora intermedia TaxID=5142 RepID=A0ABR3CYS2_NEUIN